jgi:flagellar motor switch protein FliM
MKEKSLQNLMESIEFVISKIKEKDLLEAQARDIQDLNQAIEEGEEDKIHKIEAKIIARKLDFQKMEDSRQLSIRKDDLKALEELDKDYKNYQRKNFMQALKRFIDGI